MRRLFLPIILTFILSSPAFGQTPWPDSTALESYMDGLVNSYMNENDIAGATVGIIKEGKPVLLKGYGYANVEKEQKVNPDSTLFRIGSISKMFVWTAVMQLAEEGKLDLDKDINQYIDDFEIPENYEEPITLEHLMTHSAGFEDYLIGLFARDSTKLRPYGEILSEQMPARVRPPATHAAYSNHGTGIAAYIVEQVSGVSFADYVEENIFGPLDMTLSTFRQPLPDDLDKYMSKGYAFESGEFREKDFEYVPLGAVGAASSTAAEMMKFMQAHLQYGQLEDESILDSTTARRMQSPAFRHHPAVNPMRHGFIDMSQNGVEIIGHGGDTFWFHSSMALFPEENLGFFISFNTDQGSGVYGRVLRDFVDHYFPEGDLDADTLNLNTGQLQRFTGSYRTNRYPHERFTKVMALMSSSNVSATEQGMLKTMDNGKANYWFAVDSLTFRNTDDSDIIAFDENKAGEITHMFRKNIPIFAFEKVSFIASQKLHFTLFALSAVVFVITLIYWPLAYGIRKRYHPGANANPPISSSKKAVAWINAFTVLLFFSWVGILLSQGNGDAFVYGVATSLKIAFILPLISVLLTFYTGYCVFQIWQERKSGIWSRIWYTLFFILSVSMLWQLYYWNLLGFQF